MTALDYIMNSIQRIHKQGQRHIDHTKVTFDFFDGQIFRYMMFTKYEPDCDINNDMVAEINIFADHTELDIYNSHYVRAVSNLLTYHIKHPIDYVYYTPLDIPDCSTMFFEVEDE